jgi:hypothetical protein
MWRGGFKAQGTQRRKGVQMIVSVNKNRVSAVLAGLAMCCFMVMAIGNVVVPKNPLTGMCEFTVTLGVDTCIMVMDCGSDLCVDSGNQNSGLARFGCLPPTNPGDIVEITHGPHFFDCGDTIVTTPVPNGSRHG